jgi:DNA end-binding protein Ku
MPRVIWKGAISFGLVHVPVSLIGATSDGGIDFDWIDRRTMDPVGYKRVNKRTGQDITSEHIARAVKVEDGRYVLLDDDEIKVAYPRSTQTVAIERFVSPQQIPFTQLERPYYLEPIGKGERVYALLREAMKDAGVVGIARVVLHSKEHLAALVPAGPALMLNTLRWAGEVKPWTELKLPPESRSELDLKPAELKMACQLIADMTDDWRAEDHAERFTQAVMDLVAQRVAAGQAQAVQPLEGGPAAPPPGNVVDPTELLKQSLARHQGAGKPVPARKAPAKASARRRA